MAPVAAFTMACILFVYARTSIRAAKANAQRHRNADSGGEGLNLMNEHRRRHGLEKRLDGGGNTITELASEAKAQILGKTDESGAKVGTGSKDGISEERQKVLAMKNARAAKTTKTLE